MNTLKRTQGVILSFFMIAMLSSYASHKNLCKEGAKEKEKEGEFMEGGINISLFPLDRYDQKIESWIKPADPNYNRPLLNTDVQKRHLKMFYEHHFGIHSPWDSHYEAIAIENAEP